MKASRKSKLQRKLVKQQANAALRDRLAKMTNNEIAALHRKQHGFLFSPEWRTLRLRVIEEYGPRCMKCGTIPDKRININVDHIKPRKLFPHLSLEFSNLQILCSDCNKAKGNKHFTDYRGNRDHVPIALDGPMEEYSDSAISDILRGL